MQNTRSVLANASYVWPCRGDYGRIAKSNAREQRRVAVSINDEEPQVTQLLRQIAADLAILAAPLKRTALARLQQEVLKTEARKAMFEAFDGIRPITEVAEAAHVTPQAVRDLVRLLEPEGLVTVSNTSRGQVVRAVPENIVRWHLGSSDQ
jgi:hypothetical protein